MTSEKEGGPDRHRPPEKPTTNKATGYPFLGHESHMRLLADRLTWLERHEAWWARQLRWHRERYGPDCTCRSCTWEPGVAA